MGLDMYAWAVAKEDAISDFEIARKDDDSGAKVEEFFYWRKHHDLHGWMENLYRAKGGTDESFNCCPVRLTLEDLDRLEKDITGYKLPHTEGFFFGDNPPDAESVERDLQFIKMARNQIVYLDKEVYYDSWW